MLVKASSERVRRVNSVLVLSALRRRGALSHTELSAVTALASGTVTAITTELEEDGIIERHEQPASGRGRPRVLLSRRRAFAHVVSVRISSDLLQFSLSDYAGTLIDRFEEPRDHATASPERFATSFAASLSRLVARSRLTPADIAVVSVSSKGIVDADGERLVWSPAFGAGEIDFAAALRDFPETRLTVSNETLLVAHGLAERMSAGREDGSFRGLIALSLGHSIGLGIARPAGQGGLEVTAPNFGHMLHASDNKLCRCGARGCVEASAGFYGILRTAFEVPPDTVPAKFVPLAEMDKIALSARQGNRMAEYAFRQAGLTLGQSLSRVLSLYETLPVMITGPGNRFYDLLMRGIEEGLKQSLHVRLNGLPPIDLAGDEATLVFEGHLDRALTLVDQTIAGIAPGRRDLNDKPGGGATPE